MNDQNAPSIDSRFGETSMSAQHHFAPGDHRDRDLYARERVLNSAIIAADIGRGWEEYLEIFDAFYADEVEVTTDAETGPIRGRERIRALLFNFLAPLHVMVEIGGLAIDVRESPIHGDTPDETHSAWSVNLIGVSAPHYDHQQSGGRLTDDDLSLNRSLATLGYGRPS